ncbi:MAG: arsenate reductase [Hyphomicrobiaceae bacterium]|jgi:arsenate reductase
MKATLYHNPRCSKSRAALALLEERRVEIEVVTYVEASLGQEEFERIVGLVGGAPIELVRTGDAAFKDTGVELGEHATAQEVAQVLAAHPTLMQRPVVAVGDRAVIARPTERILELL